jgi:hypothetical protein
LVSQNIFQIFLREKCGEFEVAGCRPFVDALAGLFPLRCMIHFALALPKASQSAIAACGFFTCTLRRVNSPRSQMKKPAWLRQVGFVTPSGFKPETY